MDQVTLAKTQMRAENWRTLIQNRQQSDQTVVNWCEQNNINIKRNQVWVGDITYLKTKLGWVYLAAVIDLYNREVIGYAVSKKIDTELVKQALGNAIGRNTG